MLTWLSRRRLLALPLVVLLLSSSASAASAADSSGGVENPILTPAPLAVLDTSVIQGRPLRIVLAGPYWAGKTLFCEFLCFALRSLGMADPAGLRAEFLRSFRLRRDQMASFLFDKQRVTKYTETLHGGSGGSVEIYDTPGLLSGRDIEHMKEIRELIESLDYVDAVLLVFDAELNFPLKSVLAQLSALFPPAVHANIAVLFSHLRDGRNLNLPLMGTFKSYLQAEFNLTSEEAKSRNFFVDSPLDAVWRRFDPNAEEQTIASLLQRSGRRRRYNDAVQELNRFLRYFAEVPRWNNPKFSPRT